MPAGPQAGERWALREGGYGAPRPSRLRFLGAWRGWRSLASEPPANPAGLGGRVRQGGGVPGRRFQESPVALPKRPGRGHTEGICSWGALGSEGGGPLPPRAAEGRTTRPSPRGHQPQLGGRPLDVRLRDPLSPAAEWAGQDRARLRGPVSTKLGGAGFRGHARSPLFPAPRETSWDPAKVSRALPRGGAPRAADHPGRDGANWPLRASPAGGSAQAGAQTHPGRRLPQAGRSLWLPPPVRARKS